jgi:hypothetical protein
MMKRPSLASTLWFFAFAAVSALYVRRLLSPNGYPQIVFDTKAFFDSGDAGYGSVYIAGTLTGDGVAYKNNTAAVTCYQDRMQCVTASIEQIGPNQVGRLESPSIFPVVKWDSYEIVATGAGDAVDCRKVTISIERKSETAVWVEEPINQSSATCKNAETRILKWTIEDSPAWRALR